MKPELDPNAECPICHAEAVALVHPTAGISWCVDGHVWVWDDSCAPTGHIFTFGEGNLSAEQ